MVELPVREEPKGVGRVGIRVAEVVKLVLKDSHQVAQLFGGVLVEVFVDPSLASGFVQGVSLGATAYYLSDPQQQVRIL